MCPEATAEFNFDALHAKLAVRCPRLLDIITGLCEDYEAKSKVVDKLRVKNIAALKLPTANSPGTLWQSEDDAWNKIAVGFYARLHEMDNVAEFYRYAMMKLMKQKPL